MSQSDPNSTAAVADEIDYPSADGKPMAETPQHLALMLRVIPMLQMFFAGKDDVIAGGNQFLYYQEGDPRKCTAPDIYVLKGVEPNANSPSIKLWLIKTPPSFILELTSQGTAQEDLETKKQIYQDIGVPEYFLYDPLHEYLPQQLMGFRLLNGVYEPLIPGDDGGLLSNQLQLRFVPDGVDLQLINFRTRERLKSFKEYRDLAEQERLEAKRQREEADQQRRKADEQGAEAERQRRKADEQGAEAERQRQQVKKVREEADQQRQQLEEQRQLAEKRAAELADEVARLRALLSPKTEDDQAL